MLETISDNRGNIITVDQEPLVGALALEGAGVDKAQPNKDEVISDEEEQFQILNHGYMRGETAEDLQIRYIYLTERTIKRICGFGDPEDKVDRVIFLDKSARPVAWMVRKFWNHFAEDDPETGEQMKMPSMSFLNIDKDDWVDREDVDFINGLPQWNGKHTMGDVAQRSLRSTFVEHLPSDKGIDDSDIDLGSDIDTVLDGQKVLVIDEVGVTGITKRLAVKQLRDTFPRAEFESWHWMRPPIKIDLGAKSFNQVDNPVWYNHLSSKGRGVANRSYEISEESKSRRQRLGKAFLSTRPKEVDQDARNLRSDITLLEQKFSRGEIKIPEDYSKQLDKKYGRLK